MILIAILSITLYLVIGLIIWLQLRLEDITAMLTKWDCFWIITSWLPMFVIVGIEILVEYIKSKRK